MYRQKQGGSPLEQDLDRMQRLQRCGDRWTSRGSIAFPLAGACNLTSHGGISLLRAVDELGLIIDWALWCLLCVSPREKLPRPGLLIRDLVVDSWWASIRGWDNNIGKGCRRITRRHKLFLVDDCR